MNEHKKMKCHKLSGGMVRRVGIAQAFLNDPDIIVMDEPTVGLDPEERDNFYKMIENMQTRKIIIISSHILEDIERVCDNMMIMKDGHIIFNGKCVDESDNQNIYDRYRNIINGNSGEQK